MGGPGANVVEYLEGQPHGGALKRAVVTEIAAVRGLREFNKRQSVLDPARLTWPATLPIELALKTASPQELKVHYEYSDEDWDALRDNPVFIRELAAAIDMVKQDGMSFRMKCKLQAEAMLETSWKLVHGPASEVPAAVKARLMETTFRMAGYDSKEGVIGAGNQLAIQINFNGPGG
jgi:hypothetical protein